MDPLIRANEVALATTGQRPDSSGAGTLADNLVYDAWPKIVEVTPSAITSSSKLD